MAFVWPDSLISSEFNHNALNSLKVRVFEGEGFSCPNWCSMSFDVQDWACRLLQTVVDCRRFGQLRHQDMSSVGARLAAKDSLGLQSGLRGWQRLPVNSFQAARRARRSARSWSWNTGTDWNAGTPWTISDDFGLALSCQERCGWRFIPQGSKKGSGSISAIGLTQSLKQHQPENGEQNHQILIKIIEYVNICKYFIQNQYSSIFINIQYPTYFSVFNAFFEPRISMFFFQIWSTWDALKAMSRCSVRSTNVVPWAFQWQRGPGDFSRNEDVVGATNTETEKQKVWSELLTEL